MLFWKDSNLVECKVMGQQDTYVCCFISESTLRQPESRQLRRQASMRHGYCATVYSQRFTRNLKVIQIQIQKTGL